jgi:hypothetical protein
MSRMILPNRRMKMVIYFLVDGVGSRLALI